jgi:hypothetical protein
LFLSCESEPKNYDECILKYVKEGMNERAVNTVTLSCMNKFEEVKTTKKPLNKDGSLNSDQLSKLTGRAGLKYGDYYSGSIYNGNDNLIITEVEISITITLEDEKITRKYIDEVFIEPKTTGDFGFDIIVGDEGAEYSWFISAAKARKS